MPPELLAKANERAGTSGFSDYIRTLIERDLSAKDSETNALSPTILEDLTRRLLGEIDAREVAAVAAGKDQPRLLRAMLRRYIEEGAGGKATSRDHPLGVILPATPSAPPQRKGRNALEA